MADILKYDMTNIWASAGDVVAPDNDKVRAGWGVEVVPRQWWNWFENRQDNNIAYILQKGFPEWDATTEYIINKSYVQRNGLVYKATATTTGVDPVGLVSWVRVFADYSVASNALGALTPTTGNIPYFTSGTAASQFPSTEYGRGVSNLSDIGAALTYFGAQATNANLTALSALTGVANALPYFNGGSTMTTTNLTSFGRSLIDDADAATARATLALGTAAVADVTVSAVDGTVGRVLKVGDYGIGAVTGIPTLTDLTGELRTGFYLVNANSPGLPADAATAGGVIVITRANFAYFLTGTPSASRVMYHGVRASTTGAFNWVALWDSNSLVKTTSQTDTTAGRMLKVGDWGLGTITTPRLTTFLADNPSGIYHGLGDTNSQATPGAPVNSGNNSLSTICMRGLTATASYNSYLTITNANDTAGMWFAGLGGASTPVWREVYHSGNIATARTGLGLNSAAVATTTTGSGSAVMATSPTLTGTPLAPTAAVGTNTTQLATTAFVLQNASANPPGTILAFAGATIPAGYLLANGAALSRTTYATLFAAISTVYGAGDGSTTFLLPDLRGEYLRGLDNGRGVDSGRSLGTWQNWQLADHTHTFTGAAYAGHVHTGTTDSDTHSHTLSGTADSAGAHAHTYNVYAGSGGAAGLGGYGAAGAAATSTAGAHTHTVSGSTSSYSHSHAFTTATAGAFTPSGTISNSGAGSNSSENRVRNVAVQFVIKF